MTRFSQTDVARLGPAAQRQIDAVKFAYAEQQRQMDLLDKPRNKYRNRQVEYQGQWFDSVAELERYKDLKLEQRAGLIENLVRQPRLRIVINGVNVCSYYADFLYVRDGAEIYEDVKGCKPPLYRLKAKLVRAVLGIEIQEIQA